MSVVLRYPVTSLGKCTEYLLAFNYNLQHEMDNTYVYAIHMKILTRTCGIKSLVAKSHLEHKNQYQSLGFLPPFAMDGISSFCFPSAVFNTGAFPSEHPEVVCHHVHNPYTVLSLFHFPHFLVKSFTTFSLTLPRFCGKQPAYECKNFSFTFMLQARCLQCRLVFPRKLRCPPCFLSSTMLTCQYDSWDFQIMDHS